VASDDDAWDRIYAASVRDGYDFGLSGAPFPDHEPIGSAWAFGYRHGATELRRVQTCNRLGICLFTPEPDGKTG
jgi:hypothetical protein